MKKMYMLFLLLSLLTINCYSQTFNIVGKGVSGKTRCSGYIEQSGEDFGDYFTIYLSDILQHKYQILNKEQIDKRTIKYNIIDINLDNDNCYIIKQKCPNGKYTYFFEFPPLYSKQGRTVYKAVKKKIVINGFVVQEGE